MTGDGTILGDIAFEQITVGFDVNEWGQARGQPASACGEEAGHELASVWHQEEIKTPQ